MKRDILAGALLVNTIPHAVLAAGGQRCLTPLGGPDSTPRQNLLWAGMNLTGAVLALSSSGWRGLHRTEADRRRRALHAGMLAMTAFGALYELTR